MGLNEPNTTKVDQKRLKWTEWIEVDQIGLNGPDRMKVDQTRPKWTK